MHRGLVSPNGVRQQTSRISCPFPKPAVKANRVKRCAVEGTNQGESAQGNGVPNKSAGDWLKIQLEAAKTAEKVAAAGVKEKSVLNLQFESDKKALRPLDSPVKTTGLHRAPLSGGVKTATQRYDLPTPPVAVRNLVEQAQFGHLCTIMSGMHHRRCGYPFGTLVDIAVDGAGLPILCLSPLAIHARNLIEEPRCSLVVQMPGWNGLANARVTIFGDVYQLPAELQASARDIFSEKHAKRRNSQERWVSGNFVYFRMHKIVDIYFVGGFGTVQWIEVEEYMNNKPDAVVMEDSHITLKTLNEMYAPELKKMLSTSIKREADDAMVISIDAGGADVRVRCASEFSVERIGFGSKVHTRDEAVEAMRTVLKMMTLRQGAGVTK